MSQGGHSKPLLLLALFYWWTSSWTCRTTPRPWSRCPPGQFFWLDETRVSFWATFIFSTFLPEHSFMLKSYRWGGWVSGVGWVAHGILVSSQVPSFLTLGLWTLGLGLGLDNCQYSIMTDQISTIFYYHVCTNSRIWKYCIKWINVTTYLQLICGEAAVVPEHLIVAGPARPLDPLVAEEVEVSLGGVVDALVHHGPRQSVPVPILVIISREKPGEDYKMLKKRRKKWELNAGKYTVYLVWCLFWTMM